MHSFFVNNLKGAKALGLNIWIKQDNKIEISAVLIGKKANQISVICKEHFKSIEEVGKKVSLNTPIYLSIDGKGIIHKVIDSKSAKPFLDLVIPGADINLFCIKEKALTGNRDIVSVIRKDKLQEILTDLKNSGLDVLKIFLGPFSVSCISQSFEDDFKLILPYYDIYFKKRNFEEFDRTHDPHPDFNIEIDTTFLESDFIIPFSNCLHHYIENTLSMDDPELCLNRDNFIYKKLFRFTGWGILIIFLITLLINYLVYVHFRKENQILESRIGENKEILEKITKIKSEVNIKEGFLKNNSHRETPLFAFYSDRLAKNVPRGITLVRLNLSPFQKQSKVINEFYFLNDIILISGYTYNSGYLDTWLKELEKFPWIQEMHIKSYIDNGSGPARFELEILLLK